jgi:hypothetical protein
VFFVIGETTSDWAVLFTQNKSKSDPQYLVVAESEGGSEGERAYFVKTAIEAKEFSKISTLTL